METCYSRSFHMFVCMYAYICISLELPYTRDKASLTKHALPNKMPTVR